MHAQGLSSGTKRKKNSPKIFKIKRLKKNKKEKEKEERGIKKNLDPKMENSTSTISLGRDSRSPFLLRTEQITTVTRSEQNPSVDAAPVGGQRKEKRLTDTRKRQGRARPNQQGEREPWETLLNQGSPWECCGRLGTKAYRQRWEEV